MKLTELEPRWIHPNIFAFRCPHCSEAMLTCKNVVMSHPDQHEVFKQAFGDNWNMLVVPCKEEQAWTIDGTDFNTITVNPSLDASASGHWHGCITKGEAL